MSNHATAIAFLFLLAAVPLHAQVTVKDYRAASTNDPANLLVQTYIKGLGEGIMLANLEAERKKVSPYYARQKLALTVDNYVNILEQTIKDLEANKYPAEQLDTLPISIPLMHGLEVMFACPANEKSQKN